MNSKFVVLKFKDSLYCYKCQVDMQNTPLTLAIVLAARSQISCRSHKRKPQTVVWARVCAGTGEPLHNFLAPTIFLPNPKVFSLVGTGNQIPVVGGDESPKLGRLVAEEAYEEAAKLRDEISRIEQGR